MDPGFRVAGGLGPRKKVTNFTNVAEWSNASNVSKYWLGSRVHLGALKALAYNCQICILPLFGTFPVQKIVFKWTDPRS